MSNYYGRVSAVESRFDPTKIFATEAEARSYDRNFAARFIADASHDDVMKALDGGDHTKGWWKVLAFLHSEWPAQAAHER